MPDAPTLSIGQVARAARVPLDTVRYYERRGLLPTPPRTPAGYRQYPADTVARVRFVKQAQGLGFTLEEIEALLALRVTAEQPCEAVERQARAAIERIDGKLEELSRMRRALTQLATACRTPHPADECPLLTALDATARDGTAATPDSESP